MRPRNAEIMGPRPAVNLDHPSSTAARMWGPLTAGLSSLVSVVARGHRQGTHDALLGPAVVALLTWLAITNRWTSAAVMALVIGLTLRGLVLFGLGRVGVLANLVVSVAGGWILTTTAGADLTWLPLVSAVGMLTHIVGDFLTQEGIPVPVMWLVGDRRRLSAHLFRTGQLLERALVAPALCLLGIGLLCVRSGIHDLRSLLAVAGHLLERLPA